MTVKNNTKTATTRAAARAARQARSPTPGSAYMALPGQTHKVRREREVGALPGGISQRACFSALISGTLNA